MNALVSRPPALLAVAVLVVNDHVLKALCPGFVTGKLSDVAGLFFFPLLLVDIVRLVTRSSSRYVLPVAAVATAIVFVAVKTWAPAHDLYCAGLGAAQWTVRSLVSCVLGLPAPHRTRVRLVMDAGDLAALPAVWGALRYAWRDRASAAPVMLPSSPRTSGPARSAT